MRRTLSRLCLLAALVALSLTVVPPASAVPDLGKLISLDADDAYLPAVLKLLAEKGDLNIVTGPGVTSGKVTIHLKDVPVEQAVNLVVRAAGLAYERIGNSILVAESSALSGETGLSSYTIPLKYADATEMQVALSGLSDKIQVDRGGNRLIVVTSPRVIAEIQEIVVALDQPAQQVMLEARILEVSTDDLKELGVDWDLLTRQGFTSIEDSPPPPVGADGNLEQRLIPNTPGTNDIWKLKNFSRLPMTFRLFLDLLVREGSARVLAQPKLVTLNGKPASMLAGQRIPYLTSQTVFAGGAAAPTETVQMEEVGIKLSITPLINADGYITVQVRPEVSTVVGFRGDNNDLPVVATRQAETTVRLKDGASVIIGGLLSEELTKSTSKVPLLGDVPGLGWLFRHESTQASKRDLVIEVTPRLLAEAKRP